MTTFGAFGQHWAKMGKFELKMDKFVGLKMFLDLILFNLNFWDQNFLGPTFLPKLFLDPILLGLKFFGHGLFLDQKNFGRNFFFCQKQQQQ